MTDTQMVIAGGGDDSIDVYAGTYDVARQIFDSYVCNLDSEIIEIAKSYEDDSKVYYFYTNLITRVLCEIYTLEEGQPALKYSRDILEVKDKASVVLVSNEMKTELAVWMMKHKLGERDLSSASTLVRLNALGLDMFKPLVERIQSYGKELKFCDYDDYFDAARRYRVIINNKWKADATEQAKIRYVLEFVNSYLLNSRYDKPFELCKVKNSF